ncbi:hypothetical protein M0802_014689 [Mischocyttarus mexicanus]|nr:hypothetical protein M0802_014695 [Mischocyttarus mexicanus]KAI4477613.1 hypothetical protein M0802_014689 [Mischocyttarus mexicanus]
MILAIVILATLVTKATVNRAVIDLTSLEPHFDHSGNSVAYLSKSTIDSVFGFGWGTGRNNSQWEARWRRLRAIPS